MLHYYRKNNNTWYFELSKILSILVSFTKLHSYCHWLKLYIFVVT